MNLETPAISASNYANNSFMLGAVTDLGCGASSALRSQSPFSDQDILDITHSRQQADAWIRQMQQQAQPQTMPNPSRRVVQVFIADPNDNVPLDDSVLYRGEQKLTDATDSELYFEVPIAEILKSHNAKRVGWPDKEASKRAGKDIFLDPVKIRDLKMVVVTIAQF